MEQNDYFLNQLYNPEFSPGDFQSIGLNSGNTTIRNIKEYEDLDIVKNNPLLLTNGELDKDKLNKLYQQSLIGYNMLSNSDHNERLATTYSAFRDDIFAKSANRVNLSETFITKIPNPNRLLIGFVSNNIMESPKQSVREIAQSQLVWDGETNSWTESPNDTPVDNFFNPKVLAQYDEDIDINGKSSSEFGFDKEHIAHKKGEKKINPLTGTYYYETLNGRDIYGRDVLSGWDTLTKDGSRMNKYDFFDSDDLEKSFTGSLVKSVVKIAPALIPTIAPWYVGTRVLLGASDLFAKVGKMIPGIGSDSPKLSYLEGLNASWTLSTSDWSRGSLELGMLAHAWSLENILNLSADVFTQLAELRWMFTHLPSLLKGNKLGFSTEALEKFKRETAEKIIQKYKNLGNNEILNPFEKAIDLKTGAFNEALILLESKLKEANKIGEHLSKLYMTGITVADSYGEAKEQGLSDTEAAIFTLAYAAGEYGILSTNLGEHILPELRAEKHKYRNIERVLREGKKNASDEVKNDTRKWYQELMRFAKEAVYGDFNDAKIRAAYASNSTSKALLTSVVSNALGEGLEEVSEEIWYDVAKGLLNAVTELGLTQTGRKLETFDGWNLEQTLNRYALNFVGGLVGGAVAVGLPGFLEGIKNMLGTNMDLKQAYQELVALIRNGKKDDFLRTVDKLETANSKLSATEYEDVDGLKVPKIGTPDNNLDRANKIVLHGMVDLIDNLLTINGVKMDDQSILSKLTSGASEMARYQALIGGDEVGSATLANYLQRFNTLSTKIANLGILIDAIKHPRSDLKSELLSEREANSNNLSLLESEMKDLIEERDAYLDGSMAKMIIPKVIFEMSPVLSFPFITTNFKDYAEKLEGKVLANIPDSRLEELKKSWENYKNGEFKDDIEFAFLNFMLLTEKLSEGLKNFDLSFLKNPRNFLQDLGNIFSLSRQSIIDPENDPEDIQENTLNFELSEGIAELTSVQKNMLALHSLMETIGIDTSDINILMNAGEAVSLEELLPGDILNIKRIALSIGEPFDENSFTEADVRNIKESFLKRKIYDVLVNNSDKVKDVLSKIGYFNQATRDFLKNSFLRQIMEYDSDGNSLSDPDIYDPADPETNAILQKHIEIYNEYKNIIDSKPITPIEQLADLFQLAIGDNHIKISDLITTLLNQMTLKANLGTIEEFGFGVDVSEQIKNALQIIDILGSIVLGARSDGGKLGAIFGFNSTVNLLNPDMKLTEIEKDSANTLMLDLSKLKTKLEYFLTIFNVNSGLKLEELKKIHNRVNYAFINKMKLIVQALPPDNWNKKDESGIGVLDKLLGVINKATTYNFMESNKEDTRFNLNSDQSKLLEKESINILDALYDFFLANIDKLENGELDLSMLKILPSTDDVASDYNGTLIDLNLTQFDDRIAIMLMATCASIKASDFYAEYKNSLVDGIAPIPGQELAVRMAYAFLLNKPMFLIFGKAYNDKLLEEIKGSDSAKFWTMYGKSVTESGKLDNSYALLFLNTFLVEGIPGAGKTQGFQHVLYNMLLQYHPELLDEVWFVHTDESKAEAWAKKIGADVSKSKFFSKKSYLETIYPKYTSPKTNESGVITITESELLKDEETGIYHFKDVELSKTVKVPSLILIDESTRFSQQEMLISEAFQELNDVSAVATGDYDLIGATGQFDMSNGNKNFLNTSADNFFHSPKLGSSMRTENTIKDLNIAIARKNKLKTIQGLIAGTLVDPLIKLSYYLDNTGLYGERIIGKDSTDLDTTITLMLNTLKGEKDSDGNWNGEKITVIYLDINSDIYKKLLKIATENEEFKGKINFVESSAAQGDEGQYYIVDLKITDIGPENSSNVGNHANFVNTFYTAISRSAQGTLIIENPNIKQISETQKVDELVRSPLSEEAKAKFSKNRIDVLSEIITTEPGKTPKAKRRTIISTSSTEETEDEGEASSENNEDESKSTTELNKRTVNISNDESSKKYNMLIHSMPANESGFIDDGSGKLIPSVGYDDEYNPDGTIKVRGRIDGLNGLTKMSTMTNSEGLPISDFAKNWGIKSDRTLVNLEEALKTLNEIVQIGLYTSDKSEVKRLVKETLGLNLEDSEFGVDFLFMIRDTLTDNTHVEQKKKGGFLRFLKDIKESVIGIFRGKNTPIEALEAGQNKEFALNIYRVIDGKRVNILTTSLAIFTNPLTMLNTEGFLLLKVEYQKIKDSSNAPEKFLHLLLTDPVISKLPNADKLRKHLEIYTYKSMNGDVAVYLDGTLRELADSCTGPTITVNDEKGFQYFHSPDYKYAGEYTDISAIDQSVHHLTENIYYSKEDIIINGKTIVKKGHGFVLCSEFYRDRSDEDLFQLFVNEELNNHPEGKISVIYVSSPKVSITDYFKNFALKYKRGHKSDDEPDVDSNIGNIISEFRIADFITKNDSPFDLYIKQLITSNPTNKTAVLAKWDVFKSIVQQISSDFESLDGKAKEELLKKLMKDTPYINLIKYDGTDTGVKNIIEYLKNVYGDGNHSVKSFIANTLLNFVLKLKNGFIDDKLQWDSDGNLEITQNIIDNISKVEESLPNKFKEGIFTAIHKKKDTEALHISDYTFIQADADNYENQYGKFRINGKIDSTMLVMDVSSIMDTILDTIHDKKKKAMQQDWYRLDNRKHIDDSEEPTKVEDIISKELLDLFTNRSEFITLILNNIKNFENLNEGDIIDIIDLQILSPVINDLGYMIVTNPNSRLFTLVKIPTGYSTNDIEDNYIVVHDSSGKYYELQVDGTVSEINDESWFDNDLFDKDDINEIKENASKDLSTLTDPEDILLAKIWQQIHSKIGGEESSTDINSILTLIDTLPEELFTDSNLLMFYNDGEHDIPVTKEQFKADITDYIQTKNKDGLNDFITAFAYQNVNNILDKILTSVEEAADNYKGC